MVNQDLEEHLVNEENQDHQVLLDRGENLALQDQLEDPDLLDPWDQQVTVENQEPEEKLEHKDLQVLLVLKAH